MTDAEKILIIVLEQDLDLNTKAVLLQNFIAENGFLSEEAGAKVREILKRQEG